MTNGAVPAGVCSASALLVLRTAALLGVSSPHAQSECTSPTQAMGACIAGALPGLGVCAQHQYSAAAQHVPFVWRLHRQGVCSVPVHCVGRLQQQCWYPAGCMSVMHFVWRVERWQCHSTSVVVAPSWVHVTSAIRVDETRAQTLRQCVYVRHHCSAGTNSSITSWVLWLDMCASGCMECSLHGCGQHHCLPMD